MISHFFILYLGGKAPSPNRLDTVRSLTTETTDDRPTTLFELRRPRRRSYSLSAVASAEEDLYLHLSQHLHGSKRVFSTHDMAPGR